MTSKQTLMGHLAKRGLAFTFSTTPCSTGTIQEFTIRRTLSSYICPLVFSINHIPEQGDDYYFSISLEQVGARDIGLIECDSITMKEVLAQLDFWFPKEEEDD